MGLFDSDNIPAFEDVTQQVTEFLRVPICIITIADDITEYVKAAYGLSHLGLGNSLARLRQISLEDGLGRYVLDTDQPFFISDTGENPVIAASRLAYTYDIGAYGAVPLVHSSGQCIGILAVMDRQPRSFTLQEQGYMAMAARWGMSEYERCYQQMNTPATTPPNLAHQPVAWAPNQRQSLIDAVRLHLIGQLTQDLRSPLTAALGMTSMLEQEIYGPLTQKQREYIEIIHTSNRAMMERVEDIVELGLFERNDEALNLTPVDIEMLGQQIGNTLGQLAAQRSQTLSISIEPGKRVWTLDKSIVKQILYHVVFSIMQMAGESSTIRVHASHKGQSLQFAVWLSNPWLGEGLPQSVVRLCHAMALQPDPEEGPARLRPTASLPWPESPRGIDHPPLKPEDVSREMLGLLLSQHLAEHHGGHVKLQGSLDAGYRFVAVLPAGQTADPPANRVAFTQA